MSRKSESKSKNERVLVIAAHPDDEVLGCGATMARHTAAGDDIRVVIAAEGWTSRDAKRSRRGRRNELDELEKDTRRANKILGVGRIDFLGFPDNRMDSMDLLDVVKPIEAIVSDWEPTVVYTHHRGDLNVDHRILNEAVLTACRPLPGSAITKILFFEVLSASGWMPGAGTDFAPTEFVDVSDFLESKRRALDCYRSEMRPFPHARSPEAVEHLARWRGALVGLAAAEAFQLGRAVRR